MPWNSTQHRDFKLEKNSLSVYKEGELLWNDKARRDIKKEAASLLFSYN